MLFINIIIIIFWGLLCILWFVSIFLVANENSDILKLIIPKPICQKFYLTKSDRTEVYCFCLSFIYLLQPMGGVFEKSMFYWIFITFFGVVWGPSVPAGCSENSPCWWAWGESISCSGQGKISYLLYLRFKWMSLFLGTLVFHNFVR